MIRSVGYETNEREYENHIQDANADSIHWYDTFRRNTDEHTDCASFKKTFRRISTRLQNGCREGNAT